LTFTYYNLDRNAFGEIPCTCHGGVRAYNDGGGGGGGGGGGDGGSGMLMVIVVRIAESSKSVQLAMTGHVLETCYRFDTRSLLLELVPPVYISSLSPSLFSVP